MVKRIYNSLGLRLLLVVGLSIAIGYAFWERDWIVASCCAAGLAIVIISVHLLYKRNARKVAFLFDAIEGHSSDDKLVNESLNRITRMLFQAKAEAIQREKYYELIMNQVNTGIIVEDDKGNIVQTNREATRLLGLTIFTHVRQLSRIDEAVERLFEEARAGEKHQISFTNERGTVHLSVRVSEMTLREKHVRILAINDINSELDDKEIESWIRLTRVLTHEIMNSITPITSLSDTLLTTRPDADTEIRTGLEVISATGKNLMSFVESYRKFTHIPTPQPTLFYVRAFSERMVQLAYHQNNYPGIDARIEVEPESKSRLIATQRRPSLSRCPTMARLSRPRRRNTFSCLSSPRKRTEAASAFPSPGKSCGSQAVASSCETTPPRGSRPSSSLSLKCHRVSESALSPAGGFHFIRRKI